MPSRTRVLTLAILLSLHFSGLTDAQAESAQYLSAEAKTSTAEVYCARGDWSKAEATLRKALADYSSFAPALQLLGYCLFKQNRYSEAITYLEQALNASNCPQRISTMHLASSSLIQLNKLNDAAYYLKQIIASDTDDESAYIGLIGIYEKQGNMAQAAATAQTFIKHFPKSKRRAELEDRLGALMDEDSNASSASRDRGGNTKSDNYFLETTASTAARWEKENIPVKVYIEPAPKDAKWKAEYDEFLKKAFQTWCTASNNSVSVEYTSDPDEAKIKCHWTASPSDLVGSSEQGVARIKHADHKLAGVDVTILTTYPSRPTIAVPSETIQATCLHEIGHALGLTGHSPNPKDIMYFTEGTNNSKNIDISARDKKTIYMLYTQPLIARAVNTTISERKLKQMYSFEEGVKYMNRKEYDSAINTFTYLLQRDSANSAIRINLGISYSGLALQLDEQKRFDDAEKYYKFALDIRRQIPDRHVLDAAVKNYSEMLKDLGREQEAEQIENGL